MTIGQGEKSAYSLSISNQQQLLQIIHVAEGAMTGSHIDRSTVQGLGQKKKPTIRKDRQRLIKGRPVSGKEIGNLRGKKVKEEEDKKEKTLGSKRGRKASRGKGRGI